MNPTIVYPEKATKSKKTTTSWRRRKAFLTEREIKVLRKLNIGYGNFVANSREAGIHENTYRYIIDRGYGNVENINKIRKKLL